MAITNGELRVEPQQLRQLADKVQELAARINGTVHQLQRNVGPERIERAAGNYACHFPIGDVSELLSAMQSVAGALGNRYGPVLSSAADALTQQDAVSAKELDTTRADFTLGT